MTTNTIPYKNKTAWLKFKRSSDIINFRCFLPKTDFSIFYFELETLPDKLVKLCSPFFRKITLNKNAECFIFIQKVKLFSNRPWKELFSHCLVFPCVHFLLAVILTDIFTIIITK